MALSWDGFQRSQLFSWVHVHEVGRTSFGDGRVAVGLKPGAFEEQIDLQVDLDAAGAIRTASLWLDRSWLGGPGRGSPFASDIAKSFLAVVAPGHSPTLELVRPARPVRVPVEPSATPTERAHARIASPARRPDLDSR
ncbi:MAG TPA: hypothetical protein VEQ11_09910 [Chloroflexota bacterium]|nr:hypothetical protein [Chloroflexota bacterium]